MIIAIVFLSLLSFVLAQDAEMMYFRYANCSGCTASCTSNGVVCEDSNPSNCLNFKQLHRRVFFQKDTCFQDGMRYYKADTEYVAPNTVVQMYECESSACSSCEIMETAPDCLSLYSTNGMRLNGCNKYTFECIADHDIRSNFVYLRPGEYPRSEVYPPGLDPAQEFLTVWDGDSNCKKVNEGNIIIGKTYKKFFNVPWSQLEWFQPDNPQCDWNSNTKALCQNGRIVIQHFDQTFCGGEPTRTELAELTIFGNDDECSAQQPKYVCLNGYTPSIDGGAVKLGGFWGFVLTVIVVVFFG